MKKIFDMNDTELWPYDSYMPSEAKKLKAEVLKKPFAVISTKGYCMAVYDTVLEALEYFPGDWDSFIYYIPGDYVYNRKALYFWNTNNLRWEKNI